MGGTLLEHYMDTQKVNELIELGGLSSLGAEIGHQVDFDGPYELHIGQCVAYSRDRGDNLARHFRYPSHQDKFLRRSCSGEGCPQ